MLLRCIIENLFYEGRLFDLWPVRSTCQSVFKQDIKPQNDLLWM